jgi:hypothetical protein
VTCPICARRVNVHTDDQAMWCYGYYLQRPYPDPGPSVAFASPSVAFASPAYAW